MTTFVGLDNRVGLPPFLPIRRGQDLVLGGTLWLASDAVTDIVVRWSDPPYSTWSSPITLGTGVSSDDISNVVALPTGKVGVLWSNQNSKRYGFRIHADGADPATWGTDEVPASQSAQNVGLGMADDHLHMTVGTDGTIYAAVKTSYDTPGYTKVASWCGVPGGPGTTCTRSTKPGRGGPSS